MGRLVLGTAGAVIGGVLTGGSPIGIAIGAQIGGAIGGAIDNKLFGKDNTVQSGNRLTDLSVQTSTYGKLIPIIYRGRIAGNVIWSSGKREVRQEESSNQGGKGGGGSSTTTESYSYYTDLAVSVGRGTSEGTAIAGITKIWFDSTLVWNAYDPSNSIKNVRIYYGTDDQTVDSVIEAVEGIGNSPAYRNQAYIIFENLYLNDWGNRIPNIHCEVIGSLAAIWGEKKAQGLCRDSSKNIYMTNHEQRTILKVNDNLETVALLGRSDPDEFLGDYKAHPWRIAWHPTHDDLWVTSYGDAFVQRINKTTGAVIANIAVGIYPYDVIIADDGFVWVTNPMIDTLTKINPATNTVTATYSVAGQPMDMCKDDAGTLWISTLNEIVEWNPTTNTSVSRTNIGTGFYFPQGLAYNPEDTRIWFAIAGNNTVGVMNRTTKEFSYRNTGTWPFSVDIHPDDPKSNVYVSCIFGNRVKVLNRADDNGLDELAEWKTEVWPAKIVALPDGRAIVSNANRDFAQEVEGKV